MKPYPYQAADVEKMKAMDYRALLSMSTGSGKTAISLFGIKESGARNTLVIAPDQTHVNTWIPTSEKILGVTPRIIGNSNKAKRQALFDFETGAEGVFLVTPELFTRADISAWTGDFLVVDEAHRLATPKSSGQRRLSGYHVSDGTPASQRFAGLLLLSGTPLRNKFELAWSHARALKPSWNLRGQPAYDNFFGWQADRMDYTEIATGYEWIRIPKSASQSYAEMKQEFPEGTYLKRIDGDWHYGKAKTAKKYFGESEPGRWVKEMGCVLIHFKREDCGCGFHPNGYLTIDEPTVVHETITLAPKQKKAIKDLETQMIAWLDDNPLVAEIPLTKATRVRQMTLGVPTVTYDEDDKMDVSFAVDCESPYLDKLVDFLTGEAADENVTVFTDSQRFAAVVTARLNEAGIPSFEFSGATRKTRDESLAEFGSKYRVVVGVLSAISEGVDSLQNVCKTEVWLNTSLDNTINEQGEGRLFRTGQTEQILRIYYHDDLGLSEGRFSEAVTSRLRLAQSLKTQGE